MESFMATANSLPLRPLPGAAQPSAAVPGNPEFLTNDEAAAFLRLSPRTLEKQRVLGGGPRSASSARACSTQWATCVPGPMAVLMA